MYVLFLKWQRKCRKKTLCLGKICIFKIIFVFLQLNCRERETEIYERRTGKKQTTAGMAGVDTIGAADGDAGVYCPHLWRRIAWRPESDSDAGGLVDMLCDRHLGMCLRIR